MTKHNHVKPRKTVAIKALHSMSFFAYILESVFFRMQYFSPERLFTKSRSEIQNEHLHEGEKKVAARVRGRTIEKYLLGWVLLETLMIIASLAFPRLPLLIPVCLLVLIRLLDLIQMTINLTLFDHLRIESQKYWVESSVRNLILSLVNYFEIIVCFGLIYVALISQGTYFNGVTSLLDGFYFSGITQLTIGYGDVTPLGYAKLIALSQGLIGLMFTLFILSRFISLLPDIDVELKK